MSVVVHKILLPENVCYFAALKIVRETLFKSINHLNMEVDFFKKHQNTSALI